MGSVSNWAVINTKGAERHVYTAFDQSADTRAHKPFTEQVATQLANNINELATGWLAVALPCEETVEPGI